jgi:hypothetical protein
MGAHMHYARTLRMPRRSDYETVQNYTPSGMKMTAPIETFQPTEMFRSPPPLAA